MQAFADETVNTPFGPLSRGTLNGSSGARVTFSGYLEDLPAAPQIK